MKLSFLNQKGGCGKTTCATNTAVHLARRGRRVLLIDADQQQSSLDWSYARGNSARTDLATVTVIGLPQPKIHKDIKSFDQDYDDVIIDGPARVTAVARSAVLASDIVLIPVMPSPYDIWASVEIRDMIQDAVIDIDARYVISRKQAGTKVGKKIRRILAESAFPVLDTTIYQRTVLANAPAEGLAAVEMDASAESASEFEALIREIGAVR